MELLRELLDRAAVESKPHQSKPAEVYLHCPFCVEKGLGEPRGWGLGLNTETGVGHCFRCEKRLTGLRYTVRELARIYNTPFRLGTRELIAARQRRDQLPAKPPRPRPIELPPEYESFRGSGDVMQRRAWKYLLSRGVTPLQIAKHRVGYAAVGDQAGRVIFPVCGAEDEIYGYVGRSFTGQKPPYLNSGGLKLLWNGHRAGKLGVEIEGIFDGLSVERATSRWPGVVAVSALGSSVTGLQLEQLRKFEEIVQLPDADVPGIKGCLKRAAIYERDGLRFRVYVPPVLDGRDPDRLSVEEVRIAIREARAWNRNTLYRLRRLLAG